MVADVGGTNARFGAVDADGRLVAELRVACADHPSLAAALRLFLDHHWPAVAPAPRHGALAVAAAVLGDRIRITNNPWEFSITETRDALGLETLRVVNDFTAVALAVPALRDADLWALAPGARSLALPMAVLGPGTGLGVSGLLPHGGQWLAVAGEGGHATLAATDEHEAALLALLRRRFGHVSAERVLSGPGLVNLAWAEQVLAGADPSAPPFFRDPAEITGVALAERSVLGELGPGPGEGTGTEQSAIARAALADFCGFLGSFAGNLALTLGARGGVYLAGGILPRLVATLASSPLLERFLAKGRFAGYLREIPVFVIIHPLPAFLGLHNLLKFRAPEA